MSRTLVYSAVLAASAGVLLTSGSAIAQSPPGVYIPPNAKGYNIQQILKQDYMRHIRAEEMASNYPIHAPYVRTATAPSVVTVSINTPSRWNPPAAIAIRGPEGDVRTFAVEGGRDALHSRVIVLHPGEKVTLQYTLR
jgi:hypothetical protein